jgi:hypothetical protein
MTKMVLLQNKKKTYKGVQCNSSGRRCVIPDRRYTMRMFKAEYAGSSPNRTPVRATKWKYFDKYKRRIFEGPRGGRFVILPSGRRVYSVQEGGRPYPIYDVYKKTSKGNVNFINNRMFPNRHEYIKGIRWM